jgi:hypothetical protein
MTHLDLISVYIVTSIQIYSARMWLSNCPSTICCYLCVCACVCICVCVCVYLCMCVSVYVCACVLLGIETQVCAEHPLYHRATPSAHPVLFVEKMILFRGLGCRSSSVVECLPSMHEVLSSISKKEKSPGQGAHGSCL